MGLFDKIFRRGRDKRAGDDLTEEDFKRGAARLKEEYKVVRELGAGAEGDVREVVHLASGKHYAMKSIRRRGDRRPRELEVLKRLRHPNLVELEDWFATRTHYFLVFELATGGELLERLVDRGRYTECDAAVLTATIFNAMAFVHAHDIVHRDLKTANLMFKNDDPDAELIIVDFGLARSTIEDSATPNKDMDRKEDQKLLKTWVGTQYYQAPEIVKNKGYYGKPADIYCLGEITYMLLSGLSPFWKIPPYDLDKATKENNWEFHPRFFARVSQECKDFISKCLETNPNDRMTAEEALNHPWLVKYCPKDYREWLVSINEDLLQYEEEGLDEDAKIFVDAIKDHAEDGEWKMGHAVGDDALPERPWRPKTPPPSDKAAIAMTPGDKPLPKQPQPTTALPPAAPGASGSFEVEVSKDGKALPGMLTMGRRTSKVAYRTEDGTTKEIGAVRPRAGSEGAADFRIPEDEPPVSPITALARLSIKNPKKSSNMLVGGMEVGVLDIGRSLCPEGHLPNECTCNDRETVNLAQEIMEQMKTLSRK